MPRLSLTPFPPPATPSAGRAPLRQRRSPRHGGDGAPPSGERALSTRPQRGRLEFPRRLFFASFVGFVVASSGPLAAAAPPGDTPRTLVFFGDSLTAGYGLEDPAREAYPARVQEKIDAAGLPWRVINAGLSGETTAGGLRRVDWTLRTPADVFVLALGANDGLRGLSPAVSRRNLEGIVARVRAKNPAAKILLAGMQMPPELGPDYTREFGAIFPAVAQAAGATLIPFLLDGVGGVPDLNLRDRIHPNRAGHAAIAETVWKALRPLL